MPETDTEIQPTFDVLRLSNEVRKAVDELGYVNPTPVQRAIYEPAKKGRDLVVQARTGTGKTAAFGLPLVDGLVKPDIAAVQAMVLCPTRELALQVAREVTSLGKYRELKVVSIYGGAPMQRQIDEISAGAQILVGTPGRVLDHLRRGTLDPARIRVLVLDESDEMLSMGFLPQINEVLEALPKTLHTLLFSATVPRDVVRMAEDRLRDPSFITLSGDEIGALSIQHFTYLAAGDKLGDFLQVVETENPESAIIFCNTREQTKRVAHQLKQAGYDADWLNADLSQSERERVMAAVRESRLRFLVATDVAARGIDISHLTHVINYDFPESTEVYVHRTGRTGRAGRTGTAISMITPQDIGGVYMLKLTYRITPVERSLPSATEKRTRAELDLVEGLVRLAETRRVTVRDRTLARRLLTHDQAEIAIAMLLQDHLGPREEAEAEGARARRAAKPAPVAAPRQESPRPQDARRQDPRQESPQPASNGKNGQPSARAQRDERTELAGAPTLPDSRRGTQRKPVEATNGGDVAAPSEAPAESPKRDAAPREASPRRDDGRRGEKRREDKRREDGQRDDRGRRDESRRDESRRDESRRDESRRDESRRDAAPERPAPRAEAAREDAKKDAPKGSDEREGRRSRGDRDDSRRKRRSEERAARPELVVAKDESVDHDLDLPGYIVQDASPSLVARLTDAEAPEGRRSRGSETDSPRPRRQRNESEAKGSEEPRRGRRSRDDRPRREAGEEPRNGASRESARNTQASKTARGQEPAETNVTLRTPVTNVSEARAGHSAAKHPNVAIAEAGDPDAIREIRVNVGRKDGARPSDFRRTLVDRGSLSDADTEHVNVRPDHTFVGVKVRVLAKAMDALNGATIAGKEASVELAAASD